MTQTESTMGEKSTSADAANQDAANQGAASPSADVIAGYIAQVIVDTNVRLHEKIISEPDYWTLAQAVTATMRDAVFLLPNSWLMTAHNDDMLMSREQIETLLSGMGAVEAALVAVQHRKLVVFSDASMIDMTMRIDSIADAAINLLDYDHEEYASNVASTLASWVAEEVASGGIEALAVSPALAARGGVQSWLKAGADNDTGAQGAPESVGCEALASMLERAFEDIDDPVMTDGDYIDEQNWDDEDVDRIDDTLTRIVAAAGYKEGITIDIVAGWDGDDAEISIYGERSTAEQAAQIELVEALIGVLVDIDVFTGAVTEYNDGAHDRRSGYNDYAKTVGNFDINIDRLSAHERMSAQGDVKAMLSKAGKTPNEIEALFSIGHVKNADARGGAEAA